VADDFWSQSDEELAAPIPQPMAALDPTAPGGQPIPEQAPPVAPADAFWAQSDDQLAAEIPPPTEEELAAQAAAQEAELQREYGSGGQQALAGVQGFARGATLGISDLLAKAGSGLAGMVAGAQDDSGLERVRVDEAGVPTGQSDYDAAAAQAATDIQGIKQANRGTAITGEILGAVLPALASGGAGAAGTVARLTPAGQLASLATKMGTALTAKAAGAGARIGAIALTGAAEGATDNAIRRVTEDLTAGNVDITAERMLGAAWDGAKLGFLVGGGAAALGEGVQAGAKLAAKLPSLEDFATGRAFKAALGGANVKGVRQADKLGGPEAIGKTLLDEGIVTKGATIEDIAERSSALREQLGKQIGDLRKEADRLSGGTGPDGVELMQKIDNDVIAPLRDGINDDLAESLTKQFDPLRKKLSSGEPLSFESLNDLRKKLDERLKWDKTNPDAMLEMKRKVRGAINDWWVESAEAAAQKAGVEGFTENLKALNRKFSHVALADDLASDAVLRKLSNRFASPTDHLVGGASAIGAAAASGGAAIPSMLSGAVGAMANKVLREHGNQVVSSMLYGLSKGAVRSEKAVEAAAKATVGTLMKSSTRSIPALSLMSDIQVGHALQQARAMQDPESPESQRLSQLVDDVSQESPELAQAVRAKTQQKADYLAKLAGPPMDMSDPFVQRPMPMDPVTSRKMARYVDAASNPGKALERMAHGRGSKEDIETVKTLYPSMYQRYVNQVTASIGEQKVPPTAQQRAKLHFATGVPTSRETQPGYVQKIQALNGVKNARQEQRVEEQKMGSRTKGGKLGFAKAETYGARSDVLNSDGIDG
jgi:hypothetical protein